MNVNRIVRLPYHRCQVIPDLFGRLDFGDIPGIYKPFPLLYDRFPLQPFFLAILTVNPGFKRERLANFVPELKQAAMKVSSVVLSTQLQPAPSNTRNENPLVRGSVQLLPNLTRVVSHDQKMYFYYEVYDPTTTGGVAPEVQTSLTFYRKKVKVFETPVVQRDQVDVADRRASVFQLEVPADQFTPGLYTCQINIIDKVSGKFSFPRIMFYVRADAQAVARTSQESLVPGR